MEIDLDGTILVSNEEEEHNDSFNSSSLLSPSSAVSSSSSSSPVPGVKVATPSTLASTSASNNDTTDSSSSSSSVSPRNLNDVFEFTAEESSFLRSPTSYSSNTSSTVSATHHDDGGGLLPTAATQDFMKEEEGVGEEIMPEEGTLLRTWSNPNDVPATPNNDGVVTRVRSSLAAAFNIANFIAAADDDSDGEESRTFFKDGGDEEAYDEAKSAKRKLKKKRRKIINISLGVFVLFLIMIISIAASRKNKCQRKQTHPDDKINVVEIELAVSHVGSMEDSNTILSLSEEKHKNEVNRRIENAYNDVTDGGCDDEYNRFMTDAHLSSISEYDQRPSTSLYDDDDTDDSNLLLLKWIATVSCNGCTTKESFASDYATKYASDDEDSDLLEERRYRSLYERTIASEKTSVSLDIVNGNEYSSDGYRSTFTSGTVAAYGKTVAEHFIALPPQHRRHLDAKSNDLAAVQIIGKMENALQKFLKGGKSIQVTDAIVRVMDYDRNGYMAPEATYTILSSHSKGSSKGSSSSKSSSGSKSSKSSKSGDGNSCSEDGKGKGKGGKGKGNSSKSSTDDGKGKGSSSSNDDGKGKGGSKQQKVNNRVNASHKMSNMKGMGGSAAKMNGEKGKGSSKSTVAPSMSESPSSSFAPSKGKGSSKSSKTAAPSMSESPTSSFAPSCSLEPTVSISLRFRLLCVYL